MFPCEHLTILRGLCCDCGAEVLDSDDARVSMVHSCPHLLVSKQHACHLDQQNITRLLSHRRAILIVDLDHTLVHVSISHSENKHLKHFTLSGVDYYLSIRPGCQHFLENLSKYFELHVFTLGTREYARQVVQCLDPSRQLIHDRIRSRCDSTSAISKVQEIAEVFPNGDHTVLILDDRKDVWGDCENLVQILPYLYFSQQESIPHFSRNFTLTTVRKIEAFCEDTKPYLDYLTDTLLKYHHLFFDALDQGDQAYDEFLDDNSQPNMKNIAAHQRAQILKDCIVVFSGIFPAEGDVSDNPEFLIASFLGAFVKDELSDDVTHVITSGKLTQKIRKVFKSEGKIYLVSIDWLYACYYLGKRVPEEAFKQGFDEGETEEFEVSDSTKRHSECNDESTSPKKPCPLLFEDYLDDESLKQTLDELEDEDELSSKTSKSKSKQSMGSQGSSSSTRDDLNDIDEEELLKYANQLDSAIP